MKLITKFILKTFLSPYFKGIAALMLIMIVAHFFDFLHVFLERKPPVNLVLIYFINRIPEWFVMVMPVATLLASLFAFGSLKKHNELTAIKASGLRLKYVLAPLIVFSLSMSILSGVFQEAVVPGTKARADILFRIIRRRDPDTTDTERRNFKYIGRDRTVYSIDFYKEGGAEGITLMNFFPGTSRQKSITYAKKAVYEGSNIWVFYNAAIREFSPGGDLVSYSEFKETEIALSETPEDFSKPVKLPGQMDFFSLLAYIRSLERGGFQARNERVILHNKIAFPLFNTIVLFLGIPLALWNRNYSKTNGFFIAIIIYIVYWGTISVGKALGTRGIIPPAAGAWLANLIFFGIGMTMLKLARLD